MSDLRFETMQMPGASLGTDNRYPPINQQKEIHQMDIPAGDIPEEMSANLRRGHIPNIMPYSMQDGYSRDRKVRDYKTAVLENEYLRAEFLLDYGGRLWSLVDKRFERELLFKNKVFQPANLALRNAWYCGGVEWNIGMVGHSPFTCAPLFAAEIDSGCGFPILRMWEWERIRNTPFVIDAFLPAGSKQLLVKVRIINPNDHCVPMYWWSNMAVPEVEGGRVVVPAEKTYQFAYQENRLNYIPTPIYHGIDFSYPKNINHSADYFFDIPPEKDNWITALDQHGKGVYQRSTKKLLGRKLFVWGQGSGGKNWQKFLAPENPGYIEIQAGLAKTQLEHVEMPGNSEWEWVEAYGLLEADPEKIHRSSWAECIAAVEKELPAESSAADLNAWLEKLSPTNIAVPIELAHYGSGWGAIESLWRQKIEGRKEVSGILFPLEKIEKSYRYLKSILLNEPVDEDIADFQAVIDKKWIGLIAGVESMTAQLYTVLGMIYQYAGEAQKVQENYLLSLELEENVIARRNLAVLYRDEGKHSKGLQCYSEAIKFSTFDENLMIELGNYLLSLGEYGQCFHLFEGYAEEKLSGRLKLIRGLAAVEIGKLEIVNRFFEGLEVVDTMKEGEESTYDLWKKLNSKRYPEIFASLSDNEFEIWMNQHHPIESHLDFRMNANAGGSTS